MWIAQTHTKIYIERESQTYWNKCNTQIVYLGVGGLCWPFGSGVCHDSRASPRSPLWRGCPRHSLSSHARPHSPFWAGWRPATHSHPWSCVWGTSRPLRRAPETELCLREEENKQTDCLLYVVYTGRKNKQNNTPEKAINLHWKNWLCCDQPRIEIHVEIFKNSSFLCSTWLRFESWGILTFNHLHHTAV